jgi:voltage-gated potassium channel
MRSALKRVLAGLGFFVMTYCVAIAGYTLSGANLLDAAYMVTITVFSVGYDEAIPVETPAIKAFTILVILAGCGSLLVVVGGFIQMVTEGEVTRALGARRMTAGIDRLKNHAVICGFGRMGQIIARELELQHYPFVIIDNNRERLEEAEELGYLLVDGDATHEEVLLAARIDHATTLASVLPNDALNVFITLSARNMNPDLTILARGELPSTEKKLIHAGANRVVLPAAIGGLRLAHMIVRPSAQHLLETIENATMINDDLDQLGVRLSEIPVPPGSGYVGQTIGNIEIQGEGAFLIVGIQQADGTLVRKPEPGHILQAGDHIVVIGHGDLVPRLSMGTTPAREVLLKGDTSEP